MKMSRFMAIVLAGSLMVNGFSMQAAERLQSMRAGALQKAGTFKAWALQNKGKIIAATVTLTAIALAVAGTAVGLKRAYRSEILGSFEKNGVKVDDPAIADYCYQIGVIANYGGLKKLQESFQADPDGKQAFIAFARGNPGFLETIAQLAGVDERIVAALSY